MASGTRSGGDRGLDDLTMWQIAVLALYELGGARQRQDSEDIAVHCHKLSPARFGWKKLRHYPSLSAASEALNDARRPRNGALISGSPAESWLLTEAGVGWVRSNQHLVGSEASADASRLTRVEQKELSQLRAHPVFVQWEQGLQRAEASRVASALLLGASAPLASIERRFEQLVAMARLSEDAQLKEYIVWLNAAFTESR